MERGALKEKLTPKPGIILILTGSTGAGKTEIRSQMLEKNPGLTQLVTTTTRSPRPKEIDGRDYYFISGEKFVLGLKNGEFVEYAPYYSTDKQTGLVRKHYYGTTKAELEKIFKGKNLVSTMEISGAANFEDNVIKAFDEKKAQTILDKTLIVYIQADSEKVLKERFIARGGTAEEFEKRIAEDKRLDAQYGHKFENRVSNSNERLSYALADVEKLVKEKFPKGTTDQAPIFSVK